MGFMIKIFRDVVRPFYFKLNNSQKLLLNLLILIVLTKIAFYFIPFVIWRSMFFLTIIYWSYSVISDLIKVYKFIYDNTIGKAFLLIGLTLCTNISFCISGLLINNVTSVAPTNFPHTLVFISIGLIPIIAAALMYALALIMILTMPIWSWFFIYDKKLKSIIFPGYKIDEKNFLFKTTLLIKTLSMVIFGFFIFQLSRNFMVGYEKFILEESQQFIYQFEMFDKSPCINVKSGKVSFINDDKVLMATHSNSNYIFKVISCDFGEQK